MHLQLPHIEEILHGKYRLSLYRKLPEAYYREQLMAIKPMYCYVRRLREVKALPAASLRQQWFEQLIRLDDTRFSNDFFGRTEQEENQEHFGYLVYIAQKMLINLMKRLQQTAQGLQQDYELWSYETGAAYKRMQQEEEHIIALLKAVLVALYLDVQEIAGPEKIKFPFMDENRLYDYYFLESIEGKSLIASVKDFVEPKKAIKQTVVFHPLRGDRDNALQLKLRYEDIIKEDVLLALEESLFQYGLLDENSKFIKSKKDSHSNIMAVIYLQIIRLGIFRKHCLSNKTLITKNDIRKYLDQRYCADLEQQFRKSTKDHRELAVRKLPFLEHDPRFRG